MIYWTRTANIAGGKVAEAMAFASEVSDLVENATGVGVTVSAPVAGNPNRIRWHVQYESLAAFEETRAKLLMDPKYVALVTANVVNFVEDTIDDEMWITV